MWLLRVWGQAQQLLMVSALTLPSACPYPLPGPVQDCHPGGCDPGPRGGSGRGRSPRGHPHSLGLVDVFGKPALETIHEVNVQVSCSLPVLTMSLVISGPWPGSWLFVPCPFLTLTSVISL